MSTEPEGAEGSARKQELLRASLEYAAVHGLSDLSLRPLAKAIGSSPRVLLYLFGSKTGLVSEVLALNRAEQQELLRQARERDADTTTRESLQLLWDWIVDPARDNLRRLFFEAYVRSAGSRDAAWHDFARRSVDDWLGSLSTLTGKNSTLALAVIRGLVLDLLATNDLRRVKVAWKHFLDTYYPSHKASTQ